MQIEEKEEEEVCTRQNRGDLLNTQHANTDPYTPRTDESLALCHPHLQQRCSVHPQHPACAQQKEEEEAVFIRGSIEEEEVVVVYTRETRGGSAQHATRATSTRSSHGPMRA